MLQAGTAPLLHAPPPPNPVTICVIDTGVTPTPDLDLAARSSLIGGTSDDVYAGPNQPGHGTVVAHFAAGRVNGWGGAGAFPHARIASVRIFPAGGLADWQDYVSAMNDCRYRSGDAVRVIVLALGGHAISDDKAIELESRITKMRESFDINVVAAAGNTGSRPDFPARFADTFTVAAASPSGQLCTFSARGTNVDIAAPGCSVGQAGWDGSGYLLDGTSFAAPIVAGALAAVRAYAPQLSADQAERLLVDTARADATASAPMLDAAAALRAIGRGDLLRQHPKSADSTPPEVLPQAVPTVAPLTRAGHALPGAGVTVRTKRTIAPPRVRVRSIGKGRIRIRAINRPRGAVLHLRIGAVDTHRESSTAVVRRRRATTVRVRFLTDGGASAWVTKRIIGR
jgi:subtilisin family serine protease